MTARRVSFGINPIKAAPKYLNRRTVLDGIKFASQAEARRYTQLKLLERNGEVRGIKLQVPYRLEVGGILVCKYIADFVYEEKRKGEWASVTEDCKGYLTPMYRLKKKLLRATHGIELRESK